MKNIIAMSLLSLATLASAQTAQTTTQPQAVMGTDPAPRTLFPPAPTPVPKPALDATEIISVKAVVQEYNNADEDIKNVEKAIQSHHPGYTFNFQTGQLVEIPKPQDLAKVEEKK